MMDAFLDTWLPANGFKHGSRRGKWLNDDGLGLRISALGLQTTKLRYKHKANRMAIEIVDDTEKAIEGFKRLKPQFDDLASLYTLQRGLRIVTEGLQASRRRRVSDNVIWISAPPPK